MGHEVACKLGPQLSSSIFWDLLVFETTSFNLVKATWLEAYIGWYLTHGPIMYNPLWG